MPSSQNNHPLFPPIFPEPWASSWGEDDYGLWVGLYIDDIEQIFRWIEPGKFEMGSPTTEEDRYDDEKLHTVILTEGFWLADTACTQALWQAVMGENPSRFKEDINNPVENVSWDDIQFFIKKFKQRVPELELSLPTESQWEYACRAGTTTPFNLGENITPEQVNYDGNYPYANGKKGKNRQKTVPVKSMQSPNKWGLHEMHGNVWEWCQDWYGDYQDGEAENPTGAKEDSRRVLRGGGWINDGGLVRSAVRGALQPDSSYDSSGFRLSGQSSKKPAGRER